ncbi:MAG: single-stranded-DNA-specific exonuclease RecJ [Candidatus Moranbacteria bacterium]|nr:single-stranded-DNA-specific exonuclease RecJ [Candidatus Moranbacteria bacterium]
MKNWKLKPQPSLAIRKKLASYSKFIQTILYNRGISGHKQAQKFFDLDYDNNSYDPFKLSGIKPAVKTIIDAIKKKKKIGIYGDYDADGVTASTIVNQYFLANGLKPIIYIPDRVKEGYGLNMKSVQYLKKKGVELLITVDTGIRNLAEISYLKKNNIKVILTDHHSPPKKLPPAHAIINPHLSNQNVLKELSGAGVAFKLIQALIRTQGDSNFSPGFEKWLLDLVVIGTVADLVPLINENRILVKYGLIVLNKTRRAGIKQLLELAKLDEYSPIINTQDVGYKIAPRINAAGRMDHANHAFALLNEARTKQAKKFALELEKRNQKRQQVTTKIFNAVEKIQPQDQKIIIAGSKDWPLGIVGLVAGKICDKYHRPALIYSDEGAQIRGSARSIEQFNIIKALDQVGELLKEHGGHSQAAGFTVTKANFPKFQKAIAEIAQKKILAKHLIPELKIDYKLNFQEINRQLVDELKALEPFGMDNPEPIFLLKNMTIKSVSMVGNGNKHLKLSVCKQEPNSPLKFFQCICFNFQNTEPKFKTGDSVDIVFNLYINSFNGQKNLELKLIDIKPANCKNVS